MPFRRFVALTLAALLAVPGSVPVVSAQTALQITHENADCFVAEQFPMLEASVPGDVKVASARAYFRSAQSPVNEWYYVEGAPLGGNRYSFVLPKPTLAANTVTYYIQFMPDVRTPDYTAKVVEESGDCGGRPAAISPVGPASVLGGTPIGFGFGVAGAVLAGAGGAGLSTALLIAGGALAIVAGTAVVVTGETPPASPSR